MYEDDLYDEDELEAFMCLDCDVNTALNDEYYMLIDVVWLEAVPDLWGMLCLNCVELRLSRQLWPEDFMESPINYLHSRLSSLMLSRFCGIPDDETDELLEILKNNKDEATQIIEQLRIQNMKGQNKPKP